MSVAREENISLLSAECMGCVYVALAIWANLITGSACKYLYMFFFSHYYLYTSYLILIT